MKFVRSTLTRRRDLVKLLNNPNAIAEVGVFRGAFSRQIAEVYNETLYLIDPWNNPKCEGLMVGGPKDLTEVKEHLQNRHFTIFKEQTSQEAVRSFADETLDMVYLDAEHSYDGVFADISLWWSKVKPGGILAGHDVFSPEHVGVTQAIIESFTGPVFVTPIEKCPFLKYDINSSWYVFK